MQEQINEKVLNDLEDKHRKEEMELENKVYAEKEHQRLEQAEKDIKESQGKFEAEYKRQQEDFNKKWEQKQREAREQSQNFVNGVSGRGNDIITRSIHATVGIVAMIKDEISNCIKMRDNKMQHNVMEQKHRQEEIQLSHSYEAMRQNDVNLKQSYETSKREYERVSQMKGEPSKEMASQWKAKYEAVKNEILSRPNLVAEPLRNAIQEQKDKINEIQGKFNADKGKGIIKSELNIFTRNKLSKELKEAKAELTQLEEKAFKNIGNQIDSNMQHIDSKVKEMMEHSKERDTVMKENRKEIQKANLVICTKAIVALQAVQAQDRELEAVKDKVATVSGMIKEAKQIDHEIMDLRQKRDSMETTVSERMDYEKQIWELQREKAIIADKLQEMTKVYMELGINNESNFEDYLNNESSSKEIPQTPYNEQAYERFIENVQIQLDKDFPLAEIHMRAEQISQLKQELTEVIMNTLQKMDIKEIEQAKVEMNKSFTTQFVSTEQQEGSLKVEPEKAIGENKMEAMKMFENFKKEIEAQGGQVEESTLVLKADQKGYGFECKFQTKEQVEKQQAIEEHKQSEKTRSTSKSIEVGL